MPDDRKTRFVICPYCGGRVQHDPGYPLSGYICQECGYQGSFIIEADKNDRFIIINNDKSFIVAGIMT